MAKLGISARSRKGWPKIYLSNVAQKWANKVHGVDSPLTHWAKSPLLKHALSPAVHGELAVSDLNFSCRAFAASPFAFVNEARLSSGKLAIKKESSRLAPVAARRAAASALVSQVTLVPAELTSGSAWHSKPAVQGDATNFPLEH